MDDKEWEEMVWRVCKKKKAKFLAEHSDFINGLDETEKKLFEETWHKRVQFVVIAKGSTRRIFELNLEKPIAPQICYGAMDRIRRRRWLECEKAKAVQEKVLELAAKGAALDVAKKPDDVVCAIKVVERKVDNVNRNVRKNILISRATKRRVDAYWDTTDNDNEGKFKPDFEGKDDEALLTEAWEAVHSDSMKGKRRSVCLNIYKKKHPKATTNDKAFKSFYQVIAYQLRREITYSQS